MRIEIKNRFNDGTILVGEYGSIKYCLQKKRGANLSDADLYGANLDMSCWPLWCGSLNVKTDRRLRVQLMFHTLSLMNYCDDLSDDEKVIYKACMNYANELHRTDIEKLKPMEEKDEF